MFNKKCLRNGPNVATGDCVCWDRGFDYRGADLPIGKMIIMKIQQI